MRWIVLSLRLLRIDRGASLTLAAVVFATAFVFAATPAFLARSADAALRSDVANASPFARNLQLVQERRIDAPAGDPLGLVVDSGAQLEAQLPASVRDVVDSRTFVVDTPRWRIETSGREPSFVRYRIQQGVDARIQYVSGWAPTALTRRVAARDGGVVAFDVAISKATGEALHLAAGDTIVMHPDATDPLARGHTGRVAATVTGVFDVTHPDDPFWLGDTTLDVPGIRSLSLQSNFSDSVFLLADAVYPALLEATAEARLPLRYTWRLQVAFGRLDASRIDSLAHGLRRMEGLFPPAGVESLVGPGTRLLTDLPRVLDEFRKGWAAATAILSLAAIGPAMIAAVALALVAALVGSRRRATFSTLRSRGASLVQIGATVAGETIVLVVPATAAAILVAPATLGAIPELDAVSAASAPGGSPLAADGLAGTFGSRPLDPATIAAGLIVVAIVAFVLLAVDLAGSRGASVRTDARSVGARSSGTRRVALELFAICLALGGAYLLRERGVTAAEGGSFDPLVAAVPALVGLAAGLVAVRLLPIALRAVEWAASAGRGLVPALGIRRAARESAASRVLLVLMAAVAVGMFSSVMLVHLDRAADAVGWADVGAAYRLSSAAGTLPAGFDATKLPGVSAAAEAVKVTVPVTGRGFVSDVLALDAFDFERVQLDAPSREDLPADMLGRGPEPLPVIVSRHLADRSNGIRLGDVFRLTVAGADRSFRAIEVRDSFPSLPADGSWFVVSRDQLRSIQPGALGAVSWVFLRAESSAGPAILRAVQPIVPDARLDSRAEVTAGIRGSPIVGAVRLGVALASVVALAFALVGLIATLALAASGRASETAHLATLGLSRREAAAMLLVEHAPIVGVALVAGIALGAGLFTILRGGLGLDALVGSGASVPLGVEPLHVTVIGAIVLATVTLAFAVAARLQQGLAPAVALRRGIE